MVHDVVLREEQPIAPRAVVLCHSQNALPLSVRHDGLPEPLCVLALKLYLLL